MTTEFPPKLGSAYRGRDPKTKKLAWRTVIDTMFGNDVLYRPGKGERRRSGYRTQCTKVEWQAFITGWKGNA
jgi:hypothetical protein